MRKIFTGILLSSIALNSAIADSKKLNKDKDFFFDVEIGVVKNKFKSNFFDKNYNNSQNNKSLEHIFLSRNNNNVLSGGVSFGKKLSDNVNILLNLKYNNFKSENTSLRKYSSEKSSEDFDGHQYSNHTTIPLFLNAEYEFKNLKFDNFKPFVLIGAGFSFNKISSTHDFIDLKENKINYSYYFKEKSSVNFAYNYGIGTRYKLSDSLDIDLKYQVIDYGTINLNNRGESSDRKLITLSSRKTKSKLKSNSLMLGIRKKF